MESSQSNPDPNRLRAYAFLEAAVSENQDEAKLLLAELPPESRKDILVASILGDAELVEGLLRRDPTLATRKGGPKNWDPLLYLSFSQFHKDDPQRAHGIIRLAKALLAHGADPNTHYLWEHDETNKLPALWAATSVANHPALARVLLEAGATPNDGESIYHAAEHNHCECLEVLLAFGVNLSGPLQPWNNTPLYFILGHKPSSAVAPNVLAGARWLLEHGADPNAPSYKFAGRPIHLAAANGWGTELFELLFRHGADINTRRTDGITAYVLAARHGNIAAMDWLREHGAETALSPADEFFAACGRGDEVEVKAILSRSPGLVHSLAENDRRLIISAASRDQSEAVRLMLFAGIAIDTRGEAGETALHYAAWCGNIATVKLLLAHGAPVEIRDTTYDAPPLGWACHGSLHCRNPKGDYAAVAKALLAAGAKSGKAFGGTDDVNEVLRGAGQS